VTRNEVGPFDGGIRVDNTSGVPVGGPDPDAANTVPGSIEGIWLEDASNVPVQNNIVLNSVQGGVQLDGTSTGNFILDNDISGSPDGILLWGVSGNTISGNIISDCVPNASVSESNGIYLDASSGNFILGNIISGVRYGDYAGGWGIALDSTDGPSNHNTVTGNEISDSDVGIYVSGSTAMIQNNDLNDNTIGLLIQDGAIVDAGGGTLGSTGGNNFSGYTALALATAYSGAIVDLNSDPGVGPHGWPSDAWALNNNFYSTAPSDIEKVIYHDFDDANLGFVNYATLLNVTISNQNAVSINENEWVSFDVSFTNDPQDHTLILVWNDGNTDAVYLEAGDFSYHASHQYLDDGSYPGNGTAFDLYSIVVTFQESLSGGDSASTYTSVTVNNVAPSLVSVTGSTIDENGTATVTATISDPGTKDVFRVVVAYQDGTPVDTINGLGLSNASGTVGGTTYTWVASTRSLTLRHQYLDDGLAPGNGTPSDTAAISVTVNDDDTGIAVADTRT